MIAQLYGHFSKEMVCAKAIPIYRLLYDNDSSLDLTATFTRLWTLLAICGESVWLQLFEESTFGRIFTEICTFPSSALPIARQLCASAFPVLGTNGKVRNLFIKLFTDDLSKVMADAPEALFPLFLDLLPELPGNSVFKFICFVFRQIFDHIRLVQHIEKRNLLVSTLKCGERLISSVSDYGDLSDFGLTESHITWIVASYKNLQDDECGIKCRMWMAFWAKQSPWLYATMFNSFKKSATDSTTPGAHRLIAELARFQLRISFDRLYEIFDFARAHSDSLTKYLFRFLATQLNCPEMVTFARLLTAEIFDTEKLATKSIETFFACGLREMDVDSVMALFMGACDQVGDLQTIDERRAVAKATLIIEARPDMKDLLVAMFPIQDRQQLVEADLQSAAEFLFGDGGCARGTQDQTSDDDQASGQDLINLFDPSIQNDNQPEDNLSLSRLFNENGDKRSR
jgi:hypothetical protein